MTRSLSTRTVLIALLALLTLIFTACGGGGSDNTPSQSVGAGEQSSGDLRILNTSASPTRGQSPLGVDFLVNIGGGEPPFDYVWDFDFDPGSESNAPERSFQDHNSRTSSTDFNYTVRKEDSGSSEYIARVRIRDSEGNEVSTQLPSPDDTGSAQERIVVSDQSSLVFEELLAFSDERQPGGGFIFRAGEEVSFNVRVSGGSEPFNYSWDFENNGQADSSLQSPRFVYPEPGQKTASVRVTDSEGRTAESTLSFEVLASGEAAPDVIPFADEAVILNGSPPLNTGEGRTFDNADQFVVVPATAEAGGNVLELSANVDRTMTESDLPGEPSEQDLNEDGDISDSVAGKSPYEIQWDFTSDGVVDFIGNSPSIPLIRGGQPFNPYAQEGDYLLTLTVKDSQGVERVRRVEVRVGQREEIDIPISGSTAGLSPDNSEAYRPFRGNTGCTIRPEPSVLGQIRCAESSITLSEGVPVGFGVDQHRLGAGAITAGGSQGDIASARTYTLTADPDGTLSGTEWVRQSDSNPARAEAASIGLNVTLNVGDEQQVTSMLLAFGGRALEGVRNTVGTFLPATGNWGEVSIPGMRSGNNAVPLYGHSALLAPEAAAPDFPDQGFALIAGGATALSEAEGGFINPNVYLYDFGGFPTIQDTVVPVTQLPTPRMRMASTRLYHGIFTEIEGNTIIQPSFVYAGGERIDGDPVATVEMLKLTPGPEGLEYQWETLPDMPNRLTSASAVPTNFVQFRREDLNNTGSPDVVAHVIEGITVTGGLGTGTISDREPQSESYFLALQEFDMIVSPTFTVPNNLAVENVNRIDRWIEIEGAELSNPRYSFQASPQSVFLWQAFEPGEDDPGAPQIPDESPINSDREQNVAIIGGADLQNRIDQVENLTISP